MFLKTQPTILERLNEINLQIPNSKNKKRKQLDAELKQIMQQYPSCNKDAKIHAEINELTDELQKDKDELVLIETHIEDKLTFVCQLLEENDFIIKDENKFELTNMGKIASHIAEIHPLISSKLILSNDWFSDLNSIFYLSIYSLRCLYQICLNQLQQYLILVFHK